MFAESQQEKESRWREIVERRKLKVEMRGTIAMLSSLRLSVRLWRNGLKQTVGRVAVDLPVVAYRLPSGEMADTIGLVGGVR